MADCPGGESVCTMTSLQDRTLNRSYLDGKDTATAGRLPAQIYRKKNAKYQTVLKREHPYQISPLISGAKYWH